MAGLTRPIVVKPDLKVGQVYKINHMNYKLTEKAPGISKGRLVFLTDRLAVFDNGQYRDCQMIKNYKYDWEVKRA